MVPTRFVIRSGVKRHRGGSGGGQTTGKEKTGRRERKMERRQISKQTDGIKPE